MTMSSLVSDLKDLFEVKTRLGLDDGRRLKTVEPD